MWAFSRRLAETIPDRASMEPTDRSMPPEMMTNVIPTARISRYALSMKRLRKFWTAKNPGNAIEPNPNMMMNSPRVTRTERFLMPAKSPLFMLTAPFGQTHSQSPI